MKEVKLMFAGFGVIGRGVAETLIRKKAFIREKHGINLSVPAVCEVDGCLASPEGVDLKQALSKPLSEMAGWREESSRDVISSKAADIVLEVTPGNIKTGEPGLSHILAALKAGKNVVTSNKAPLAVAYDKIMSEAEKQGKTVRFEATVGGAIPIMNLMDYCLRADSVESAYGILNGTTNYVLSKMTEEGVEMEAAVKEAQHLGYAEPDPTYDIEGIDSAAKVVILANALLGKKVSYADMKVLGITEISAESMELAKKHGYAIKLVGDVLSLEVSPRLIPVSHPLNVSGSLNALMLNTDLAGDVTLIGRGAGPKETSSAIVSDILAVAELL